MAEFSNYLENALLMQFSATHHIHHLRQYMYLYIHLTQQMLIQEQKYQVVLMQEQQ